MLKVGVSTSVAELGPSWSPAEAPAMPPWGSVLMVAPDHYDVVYEINPHMRDAAGNLAKPNIQEARAGWESLRRAYEALGWPVHVLEGQSGLPDMVFAANQAFPFPGGPMGEDARVILSTMSHPERRPEVEHFSEFFRDRARIVERPNPELRLEGNGDLLWFPGRRMLLGGYGFRSERLALDDVAALAEVPVLGLALQDPLYYHLDTCLCPLDATTALWLPHAFDAPGRELLSALFGRLLEPPPEEARRLACNAHSPDGHNVIIEASCARTQVLLEEAGYRVHRVDTGEYLKAGGSVFCMKMMLPACFS